MYTGISSGPNVVKKYDQAGFLIFVLFVLGFVSRYFGLGRNVSCEESISPARG